MSDAPARSLRERKKLATRQRILAESLTLFRSKGFESTSVEEIAVAADIAIGTLYNYFDKKSDLLIQAIAAEAMTEIEKTNARISMMRGSGSRILLAVIHAFFMHVAAYDRALLRHVLPVWRNDRELDELNKPYVAQLRIQIERLKREGEIAEAFATDLVVRVMFNLVEAEFTRYVASDKVDMAETLQSLEDQITMVLAGLTPKN